MMDPEAGRQLGMLANEFLDTVYARIIRGKDRVALGSVGPLNESSGNINTRELLGSPLHA